MEKNDSLHVGMLIRAELKKQRRTVAWLAKQLGIQRPNCYRILRSGSINTDLLLRISLCMKHNFFEYYTLEFEKNH